MRKECGFSVFIVLISVVMLFSAGSVSPQVSALSESDRRVESVLYVPPAGAKRSKMSCRDLPSARAGLVQPTTVVLAELQWAEMPKPQKAGLSPTGVSRPLPPDAFKRGAWAQLAGGRAVWRLALQVPQTKHLRIHFTAFDVGAGRVWVYGLDESDCEIQGPYTGRGPYHDGEFWTGGISGNIAVIEFEPEEQFLPATAPPFLIDQIAQDWDVSDSEPLLDRSSKMALMPSPPALLETPKAAPCHLDYSCYPAWGDAGRAVALIRFRGWDGYLYVCSAVLLNNRAGNFDPLLLTAHHCIELDSEARTVDAYFLYQTPWCNGPAPNLSSAERISGATLLVTGPRQEGDFSLLRLSQRPTREVVFAGWDPRDLGWDKSLAVIHHPTGSFKRIAFGARVADRDFVVNGIRRPADKYYRVRYTTGRTEGGSSGGGLFYRDERSSYLVGTLSFGDLASPGSTVCDVSPFEDSFGRFSAMWPALRPFLDVSTPPQAAWLRVTPTELPFLVRGSVTEPASRDVRIETNSTIPVAVRLEVDQPWIRLPASSLTISLNAPATIELSVDPTAFTTPGNFRGNITVSAAGLSPSSVRITTNVDVRGPRVTANSFRNAASGEVGVVPGSLATLWAAGLATQVRGCVAGSRTMLPLAFLPTRLSNVEVQFGSHLAPLLTLCNDGGLESVTVQVPFELAPGEVPVIVRAGNEWAMVQRVPVLPAQPGIFEYMFGGQRYAVVLLEDGSLMSPDKPARLGSRATLFATGLGPVLPRSVTNQPGAPGQEVYFETIVGIDYAGVNVLSATYAPNLVGVYTVTFEVPFSSRIGPRIPLNMGVRVSEFTAPALSNVSWIAIGP